MNTGRDQFSKKKNVILLLVSFFSIFPRKFITFLWNISNSWKGKVGLLLRYICLKILSKSCGDNVFIGADVEIKHFYNLEIGNNVSIHRFSYLDANGGLTIGNNVSIAHNTSILSFEHNYDGTDIPIKYQGLNLKSVSIDENVWIGAKCCILAGVNISSGCVIGAGAIVTKSFEANNIIVGNPAKVMKKRI